MSHSNNERVTMTHLLVPVSMMAFTMMLLFAFQTTQILKERDAYHQAMGRQEAQFQDSQKTNTAFGGLVVGTQKLATEGNKTAQILVEQLKQAGIIPPAPQEQQAPTTPVPAAAEKPAQGPVKP